MKGYWHAVSTVLLKSTLSHSLPDMKKGKEAYSGFVTRQLGWGFIVGKEWRAWDQVLS